MTLRATVVNKNQLSIGMFVQSVSGTTAINAFPPNGVLIETQMQLETLKSMCNVATIDLTRSAEEVYNLWSLEAPKSIGMVEEITLQKKFYPQSSQSLKYQQPEYVPSADKYGYQGRLVYRVLEEQLNLLIHDEPIEFDILEKQIADFIEYTQINPDLLFLESHLSIHSNTLLGVGLRAAVQLGIFGHSYQRNNAFTQTVVFNLLIYIIILSKMPKHHSRLHFTGDPADDMIFANGILRQFQKLEKKYTFPLGVKKSLFHITERFDGEGPKKVQGSKLSAHSQLMNIAFYFEFVQLNSLGSKSLTASEAIIQLKQMSKTYFDPQIVHDLIQVLPVFPTGTVLQVGHYQKALVTQQHPLRKLSPGLLLLTDIAGKNLEEAQWLDKDIQLEKIKQHNSDIAHQFEEVIRAKLEIKMPWYKKIMCSKACKRLFEKFDLVG